MSKLIPNKDNLYGIYKIDVDTALTFAVIYSNGFVSLDWLNNNKERVKFN